MEIFTLSGLKQTAAERLRESAGTSKKLVLLHVGVMALAAMMIAALDLLLENQISTTGGLSGLGTRTVLQTVRSTLQFLQPLVTPFWTVGFLWAALAIARKQPAEPPILAEGFRQVLPLLRLFLMEGILCGMLGTLVFYLAATAALFTPLAGPCTRLIESMDLTSTEQVLQLLEDPVAAGELTRAILPISIISAAAAAAAVIYKTYQLRLSTYLLLDSGSRQALRAIHSSRLLMQGHRWQLMKLDLSYWWYYLGIALISVLCYVNPILELTHITPAISPTVLYLICYGLYWLLLLGLEYLAKDRVQVTYALFYDTLKPSPAAAEGSRI